MRRDWARKMGGARAKFCNRKWGCRSYARGEGWGDFSSMEGVCSGLQKEVRVRRGQGRASVLYSVSNSPQPTGEPGASQYFQRGKRMGFASPPVWQSKGG